MRLDQEVRDRLVEGAGEPKAQAMHVLVKLLAFLEGKRDDFFRTEYRVDLPEDADRIKSLYKVLSGQVFKGKLQLRNDRFNLAAIVAWFSDLDEDVELSAPRQARLLAMALDLLMGDLLWDQFVDFYGTRFKDGPCKVVAGQPIPVNESAFGFHTTVQETSPRRLPRWRTPARTNRVMLAPETSPYVIRLNRCLSEELDAIRLTPSIRIATIHPFNSLDDIDTHPDVRRKKFGPVVPLAPDNVDRIVAGIELACHEQAQIIVLPELCATEVDQQRIAEAWKKHRGDRPAVLVAGSYHAVTDVSSDKEPYKNQLRIYGTAEDLSAAPIVDKKVPYIWGRRLNPSGGYYDELSPNERERVGDQVAKWRRHDFLERVPYRSAPVIDLFCSRSVTLAVVICADFLDDGIRDLIRDLDVSLVIIPSMSDRSRIFERLIIGHVAATRSVVAYVNAFLSDPRERALEADKATHTSRGYIRRSGRMPERWRLDENFDPHIAQPGVAVINICEDDDKAWLPLPVAAVNGG